MNIFGVNYKFIHFTRLALVENRALGDLLP